MLRRKPGVTSTLDEVDRKLLEGVDAGLRWNTLVRSTACDSDEAAMRIMRLIQQGHLEGKPGEDAEPARSVHTAVTMPPSSFSQPAPTGPSQSRPGTATASHTALTANHRAPPAFSTPPAAPAPSRPSNSASGAPSNTNASSMPPGKTLPPNALAAREALLRELNLRRSGASYPPVRPPSDPAGRPSQPGYYSVRPTDEAVRAGSSVPPVISERPSARDVISSTPPGRYSVQPGMRPSTTPAQGAGSSIPPGGAPSIPPGGTRSAPPGAGSSKPPGAARSGVDTPLASLMEELSGGSDLERWCAGRLRDALQYELSGQLPQAVATLQAVMAQNSDPRIRIERDRLQARNLKAASGVYRARALDEERACKHKEAAASWCKVLEACPDDGEAALHAATCCMESGDLSQAGVYARRAAELLPKSVAAHRLLLRFFRKTGMELNASREREILRQLAKG